MTYEPVYTARFKKNHERWQNMRDRIEEVTVQVIADPYARTERLTEKGKLNLRGCRSVHVGYHFRIIFAICEECRQEPKCEYCFCAGLPDNAILFLTVGPHDRAYVMR